ncbi:hypothetical protein [Phenylobacterium sp.]|uniref:hypothetical protein n=1 Tax=Phenylobacterium sp. TaxID=1871053 RepID=UPI0025D06D80|nr:hypothetical protein [Phenylobacterium sp.]MBX3484774.1 hypothetical protein [Phenylobacterium sp.]MCW5758618.1 hypothetical protein [Phenylobacterium sp.]
MKPQIDARRLDGQDASPHLSAMANRPEDKPGARESREAKLAQALRANLRRRKAPAVAPPRPKAHESDTD